jgi:thiol reductant ABC exporter CydC subunit
VSELLRLLRIARPEARRLALATLLGVLAAGAAVALTGTSAYLISKASQQPPILDLTVAIVAVRFFGISRGVFRYTERVVGHDAAFRVLADLRVSLYRRLEPLAPAGLPAYRSGDLLARLVADVDALQEVYLRVIPPYAIAGVISAGCVGVVGWLSPWAGLALAAGLLVAGIAVPALSAATSRRAESVLAADRGRRSASVVEVLQAAPELLAAGTAGIRLDRLAAEDQVLAGRERRVAWGLGLGSALQAAVCGLTVVVCLVTGTAAVRDGSLDGVMLAVVVLLPLAAFDVVAPLTSAAQQADAAVAAARRVFAVLDAEPPLTEPDAPAPLPAGADAVRLVGAGARWPGAQAESLRGLDLTLTPGRRIGLVGASGSGKSTTAALLMRFLAPSSGRVAVGSAAGETWVEGERAGGDEVRSVVGLLQQDAHVFDTTIEENLRVADPEATPAALREALRGARLLEWVDALPLGLQTRVGEHGARLSGGQRQRLALARLLLADRPVVILDEPGEHLDTETGDALMADLLAVTQDRAVLVISHRLAGLGDCDEIVVLDGGAVVERGAPGALAAAGGPYAALLAREAEAGSIS